MEKSDNINTPYDYITTAVEYLSEEGLNVGRSADAGSILMTCIAGSKDCIGNIAIANRKVWRRECGQILGYNT